MECETSPQFPTHQSDCAVNDVSGIIIPTTPPPPAPIAFHALTLPSADN